ncbi:MAG: response regulator [Oligoflexia bacterium]|nr:response regulator [Oligoflexia bacterium]
MIDKKELNLLIVDDSASTRVVYRHYLKNDDKYQVNIFEAQTAGQGLKILNSEDIDCVLLDYCLPDLLGSLVVEQIRKDKRFYFLPVVIFTGHGNQEVAVESMKKGANDYVVKGSVTREKFLNTIHMAIEQCDENRERVTTQRKMANLSKLASIGVLTSGVAHELNNPLAGIIGLTETIINDPDNRSKVLDRANKIIVASNRIKKIIDQLRQFSRDSYSTKDWRQINLNVIIKRAYSSFFEVFKEKNVKFVLDLDENIPFIWAEGRQVEIVMTNLITNSIDAFESSNVNREGRLLKAVTLTFNEGVKIILEDSAGGMNSNVEEHAFDPFFTTKDVGKGTGLGLSVVYGIVDKLGGNISLLNKEGKGVRFEMWFPGVPTDSDSDKFTEEKNKQVASVTPSLQVTEALNKNKPSIIIVDDEEVICEILNDFLSDEFNVKTFNNPQEALKEIESCKYDLVVTDYNMPRISGVDILFAVKASWPDTPVVVISGHAREEVEMKSVLEKGAKDVLCKPFSSMEMVISTLKRALS